MENSLIALLFSKEAAVSVHLSQVPEMLVWLTVFPNLPLGVGVGEESTF